MSKSYQTNLQKLYTRRKITPNQFGRKSILRVEVPIVDFNMNIENESCPFLDDCDDEIMSILSNAWNNQSDCEEYFDCDYEDYDSCQRQGLSFSFFDYDY